MLLLSASQDISYHLSKTPTSSQQNSSRTKTTGKFVCAISQAGDGMRDNIWKFQN